MSKLKDSMYLYSLEKKAQKAKWLFLFGALLSFLNILVNHPNLEWDSVVCLVFFSFATWATFTYESMRYIESELMSKLDESDKKDTV